MAFKLIVMTTMVGDLRLERIVRIACGDDPQLHVTATLSNSGSMPIKTRLRVHPGMCYGSNYNELRLFVLDSDGKPSVLDLTAPLPSRPGGLWAVFNQKSGVGLANLYDPQSAEAYFYFNPKENYFNMELIGKEINLEPSAAFTLQHRYCMLSAAEKELADIVKPGKTVSSGTAVSSQPPAETAVEALSGKFEKVPGKAGDAVRLKTDGHAVSYASNILFANAGTLECWVQLPASASECVDVPIISMGDNGSTGWFFLGINRGKLQYRMIYGRSPYANSGEGYMNLTIDVSGWKAGEWHHLALVWAGKSRGEGIVKIFADGALKESRFDLMLCTEPRTAVLGLGVNTANMKVQRQPVAFDELRISNLPSTDSAILKSFNEVQAGKPLELEAGNTLFLNFDSGLVGRSATRTPASEFDRQRSIDELKQGNR